MSMGDNAKYFLIALLGSSILDASVLAQDRGHPISSGIPDEFRDLVREAIDDPESAAPNPVSQGAVFAEFHVDGVRSGDVIVMIEGGRLLFDDPAAAVSRISDIRIMNRLEQLFANGFDLSETNICLVRAGDICAPPEIGKFALIVDQQVPRVDLFRSHAFIQPPEPLKPSHPDEIGLIASLNGRVSGRSGGGREYIRSSLNFDVIGGMGATSLFATGSLIDDGDLTLRYAGVQHFTGRLRAAAGFFLADPSDHFSQIDIVGAELHTTDLTRPPADTSRDTPIILFLDQDSYVDVLRGGQIIYSQQLTAGPTRIPTQQFPAGSYNVDIRIRSQSGEQREESRFFSRPNDYARVNQWEYGVQVGATRNLRTNRFGFREDGEMYFSLRANRQIGRDAQIGGRVGVIDDLGFAEAFAEQRLGGLFLRGAGLMTSGGGYSVVAQLSGTVEKFAISGRARRSDINSNISAFRGRSVEFTELNLNISRELPGIGGRLNSFARYTDRAGAPSSTAWGATWNKNIRLFDGRKSGQFTAGYQRTDRDHRFLAGFRFTWQGKRTSASAQIRHQRVKSRVGRGTSRRTTQDARYSYRSRSGSADRWSLTARASHQGGGNGRVGLAGQLETRSFYVDAQADRNFGNNQSLNYFGTFATSVALSASGLALTGKRNVQSGVLVDLNDAETDLKLRFSGAENDKRPLTRGLTFLPLRSFHPRKIQFRAERGSPSFYGDATSDVVLFPGNIKRIQPSLARTVTVFGQIKLRDGSPLENHVIKAGNQLSGSDDQGYFITDLTLDSRILQISKNGEPVCDIVLPELDTKMKSYYFELSSLTCNP